MCDVGGGCQSPTGAGDMWDTAWTGREQATKDTAGGGFKERGLAMARAAVYGGNTFLWGCAHTG